MRGLEPRVQVQGAHDGLVDVLERRVHAARASAPLGLAEDDELPYAQGSRDLGEGLATDKRDLETRELALVHAWETLEHVGRHHGSQDGVPQKLKALVGGRDGLALDGRGVRDGRGDQPLVAEVVAYDLLDRDHALMELH